MLPEHGDPAPPNAFQCEIASQVDSDKIEKITLRLSSEQRLKRGHYSASLQVLGLDQTGASVSQTATFTVIVPAVTIKVGETDTLRIQLIRPWPFSAAKEAVPVAFRVTSDLAPSQVPFVLESELYIPDGTSKKIVPGGHLKAQFCGAAITGSVAPQEKQPAKRHFWSPPPQTESCIEGGSPVPPGQQTSLAGLTLQIEPSVPSSLKEAAGTLHLQSSEFPSDLDIPVNLQVKDWWVYAAIVVFLGQLLSFWVNNWINTGRRRKLNKLAMAPVESGVVNLLLTRPELEDSADIAAISTLLDTAAQANRLGEVDAAVASIKSAQTRLDALRTSLPPPLQQSLPQQPLPAPKLLMLQSGHAYVGRQLNFVILNPDSTWKDTAMYTWEWSGEKTPMTTLFAAQNLKNIATEFYAPGQYNLQVSVDKNVVCTLPFRLERDKSLWSLSRIAQLDKLILLLAVVFAAILSYLAIDKLDTFGTVSDYALAFLGGFGLNATTSGFSAVLTQFGTNSQGKTAPTS